MYIYIMASVSRVIYVGVTNNLERRVHEHKTSYNPYSFTSKYRCFRLVYYEYDECIVDAIAREKEIKAWRRAKKVTLIEETNPFWQDIQLEGK